MTEKKEMCAENSGTCSIDENCSPAENCDCENGKCEAKTTEDMGFATLLMLVPMLTLSAFNMMGLL